MTEDGIALSGERPRAYDIIRSEQAQAEALAVELLSAVRAQLSAAFSELDNVGADAIMLNSLLIRAGTQRYYWPTLEWLLQAAYDHGHRPYTNPICRLVDAGTEFERYNPFDYYHRQVPAVDEDYQDPPPDFYRPLRFMHADLYKWEAELGTNNENTRRLYEGEDIDGRDA
jgi:hypothetical protein